MNVKIESETAQFLCFEFSVLRLCSVLQRISDFWKLYQLCKKKIKLPKKAYDRMRRSGVKVKTRIRVRHQNITGHYRCLS
jgi:hypothetical protein